jgi:hypothetical protein
MAGVADERFAGDGIEAKKGQRCERSWRTDLAENDVEALQHHCRCSRRNDEVRATLVFELKSRQDAVTACTP